MKILVFDTETTGLVGKNDNVYICQLAWCVYNTKTKKKAIYTNFILNVPIEIQNSDIHGITTEISNKGYDFSEIIDIFLADVDSCDMIVAHNLKYDLQALEIELNRLERYDDIDYLYNKKYYDTMKESIQLLKITGKYGKYKYPKLQELYTYFFGCNFENAHNAEADIKATLKCYIELCKI
jgi:DNA polymerase III epsilon subunit-like protein